LTGLSFVLPLHHISDQLILGFEPRPSFLRKLKYLRNQTQWSNYYKSILLIYQAYGSAIFH